MSPRFPNPQSGVAVVFIYFVFSGAGAALGLLSATADEARDASSRMGRHAALRSLAADLRAVADQADSAVDAAFAAAARPDQPLAIGLQLILVHLGATDARMEGLEARMRVWGVRVRDRGARKELQGGLKALKALRDQVAAARRELLIFITPTIQPAPGRSKDGIGVLQGLIAR